MVNYQRWQKLETELCRQLADKGLSARQIGDELGRDRDSVSGHCHRQGISLKKIRVAKENKYG